MTIREASSDEAIDPVERADLEPFQRSLDRMEVIMRSMQTILVCIAVLLAIPMVIGGIVLVVGVT